MGRTTKRRSVSYRRHYEALLDTVRGPLSRSAWVEKAIARAAGQEWTQAEPMTLNTRKVKAPVIVAPPAKPKRPPFRVESRAARIAREAAASGPGPRAGASAGTVGRPAPVDARTVIADRGGSNVRTF